METQTRTNQPAARRWLILAIISCVVAMPLVVAAQCYVQKNFNCFSKGWTGPCTDGEWFDPPFEGGYIGEITQNCSVSAVDNYGDQCDEITDQVVHTCHVDAKIHVFADLLCFNYVGTYDGWFDGFCAPLQFCMNNSCEGE